MTSLDHMAIVIMFLSALGLGVVMIVLSHFVGRVKRDPQKLSVYECGVPPSGGSRERFSVKFYLVAIFFLIFDIEIVFLYPWAYIFKHQIDAGPMILVEAFLFIGVLTVGYVYIWKKGALEWE